MIGSFLFSTPINILVAVGLITQNYKRVDHVGVWMVLFFKRKLTKILQDRLRGIFTGAFV
jgi:hypothetical protein